MKIRETKVFGKEWREAKKELQYYWLSSQKGGEDSLGMEIKTLRSGMRINVLFGDLTMAGAVYAANRLSEKWWYEE